MWSTNGIDCCRRTPQPQQQPQPQRRRRRRTLWYVTATIVLLWVSIDTFSIQQRWQVHAFTVTRSRSILPHHSHLHWNYVHRIDHLRLLPSPRVTIPSLYGIPIPQLDEIRGSITASSDSISIAWTALRSIGSALLSYFALIAYYDRPQGQLHPEIDTFVQVRPSQIIPNGGWGVVCRNDTSIPKGTVLGTYPGVLIPLYPSTHRYKLQQYPYCETYIWRFSDNSYIIDPTNPVGVLCENENDLHDHDGICYGGNPNLFGSIYFHQIFLPFVIQLFSFHKQQQQQQQRDNTNQDHHDDKMRPRRTNDSWFWKSTLLCRINEPPKGYDVNVVTVEHRSNHSVSFVTERTIYENEELFIDYGLNYDRSRYRS